MDSCTFVTARLLLRHWQKSDFEDMYRILSNEAVALPSGFKCMKAPKDCWDLLQQYLNDSTQFAICFHDNTHIIGKIGLRSPSMESHSALPWDMEMGAWIDVPYWGKGYIPEAVKALQKYAFEELECQTLWAAYFDGNVQSKRCLEKCGFVFHHTEANKYWPLQNTMVTEHYMRQTKEEWQKCLAQA